RLISINVYTDSTGNIYMDVVYNYTFTYALNDGTVPDDPYIYTWDNSVTFKDGAKYYSPTEDGEEPTVFFMYYPDYEVKKNTYYKDKSGNNLVPKRLSKYLNTELYNNFNWFNKINNVNYNDTTKNFKGYDTIVINNLANVPTKFFVVKQRLVKEDEDNKFRPYNDTELVPYETAAYKSCILEYFTDDTIRENKERNTVYTNAGINLRNGAKFGTFIGRKYCIITANAGGYVEIKGYVDQDYQNGIVDKDRNHMKKELVEIEEKKTRYYKVTIEIYPEGSVTHTPIEDDESDETLYTIETDDATPIYSFVGAKLQ
ncbi:MAG: hypothetical protein IK085_07360, partial [Clostridia bacterium]|nr:hypothetical protein [Clostridia bacterium]